jgi:putative glutamine amidotransferase
MTAIHQPLVGVSACVKEIETHRYQAAGDKYISAVAFGSDAQPVIMPALGDHYDVEMMVERFDGFLITGSPSNVEPHHYQGPASREGTLHDPERDATTLPLIRAAVAAGVPLLAICRGIQEFNVAFGGTLHQNVHELPGRLDHRAPKDQPADVMYAPAHNVALVPGSIVAGLAGATELMVNSLHSQAIDRLGDGLVVEATAPDGTIEAARVADAPGFALGIQWHPEYKFQDDAFGRALFAAFGEACHEQITDRARGRRPNRVA